MPVPVRRRVLELELELELELRQANWALLRPPKKRRAGGRLWSALTPLPIIPEEVLVFQPRTLPIIPEVYVSQPSPQRLGHIILDEDSSGSGGDSGGEQDDKPPPKRFIEAITSKALSVAETTSSSLRPREGVKEQGHDKGKESQASAMEMEGRGKPWWAYRSRWCSSTSTSSSSTETGSRRSRSPDWENCSSTSSLSWEVSYQPRPKCTTGTQTENVSSLALLRLALRGGVDRARTICSRATAWLTRNPADTAGVDGKRSVGAAWV